MDACTHHNPCQNGGICISTDGGPVCECQYIDFDGIYCDKGEKFKTQFKYFFDIFTENATAINASRSEARNKSTEIKKREHYITFDTIITNP